ncbi:MAG: hypothetical protein NTW74_03455 [Acidobacteria bacterium]|nr:hypothetical protein [Acidobacteriota bacterium]
MGTIWLLSISLMAQQAPLDKARLASQAQSFAEQLPNLIGTEVLRQKSISYSTRMRIRVGEAALKPIPPKIREREIKSELGYALRGKDNPVWYELRKVIDVDGRSVMAPKKARERLAFGLKSDDDRARLKMMEEFTRYGLNGLATDYSLSLLLFRFGEIDKIRFDLKSEEFVGADRVQVFGFLRTDGGASVTVFDGKQAMQQPLSGLIWLRSSDLRPLKIQLSSLITQDNIQISDEGIIEYGESKFGSVVPLSVVYVRKVNGTLMIETKYEYKDFQKFGADAELKFTP